MLFRKKIERSCAYCRFGAALDGDAVLCAKKGMRRLPDKCWKFRYDPIKRTPVKPKPVDFEKYNKEDFSL